MWRTPAPEPAWVSQEWEDCRCERCDTPLPTIPGTIEQDTGVCATCGQDLLDEAAAEEGA